MMRTFKEIAYDALETLWAMLLLFMLSLLGFVLILYTRWEWLQFIETTIITVAMCYVSYRHIRMRCYQIVALWREKI